MASAVGCTSHRINVIRDQRGRSPSVSFFDLMLLLLPKSITTECSDGVSISSSVDYFYYYYSSSLEALVA